MSLNPLFRSPNTGNSFAMQLLSILVAGCVLVAGCSTSSTGDSTAGDREGTVFDSRWNQLRAEHVSRAAVRTFHRLGWFSELSQNSHGQSLTEEQAVDSFGDTFFLHPDGSGEFLRWTNLESVFQWLLHRQVNLEKVPDGTLKTILADYYSNRLSHDAALSQMRSEVTLDRTRLLQVVRAFVETYLPPSLANALSLLASSELASGAPSTNPLLSSETAFALAALFAIVLLIAFAIAVFVLMSGKTLPPISLSPWPGSGADESALDPADLMEITLDFAGNLAQEVISPVTVTVKGVDITDADGNHRSVDDILQDLANRGITPQDFVDALLEAIAAWQAAYRVLMEKLANVMNIDEFVELLELAKEAQKQYYAFMDFLSQMARSSNPELSDPVCALLQTGALQTLLDTNNEIAELIYNGYPMTSEALRQAFEQFARENDFNDAESVYRYHWQQMVIPALGVFQTQMGTIKLICERK